MIFTEPAKQTRLVKGSYASIAGMLQEENRERTTRKIKLAYEINKNRQHIHVATRNSQ